jgi:hypothetical protein
MPDPTPTQSFLTTFLATTQGKLISALTILVLLLGVAAEVISITTSYYNMVKARAEANVMTLRPPGMLPP